MPVIEKGVPLPPARSFVSKYPFRNLSCGDSFLVENPEDYKRAKSAAANVSQRTDFEFSSRMTNEGLRIWRVK